MIKKTNSNIEAFELPVILAQISTLRTAIRNLKQNQIKTDFKENGTPNELHRTRSSKSGKIDNFSKIDSCTGNYNQSQQSKICQKEYIEFGFELIDNQTGEKLLGLIDTKNESNLVSKKKVSNEKLFSLAEPFHVQTVFGQIKISHVVTFDLFSKNLIFLVADDSLGEIDIVLGIDALEKLEDSPEYFLMPKFRFEFSFENEKIE